MKVYYLNIYCSKSCWNLGQYYSGVSSIKQSFLGKSAQEYVNGYWLIWPKKKIIIIILIGQWSIQEKQTR